MPTLTRRRVIAGGAAVTLLAGAARGFNFPPPSQRAAGTLDSDVTAVSARVYDAAGDWCALDLTVTVAPGERIVIEDENVGGSDRTVSDAGRKMLTAVVPADSDVLLYAVDLDAGTSRRLREHHITEDCTLTNATTENNATNL